MRKDILQKVKEFTEANPKTVSYFWITPGNNERDTSGCLAYHVCLAAGRLDEIMSLRNPTYSDLGLFSYAMAEELGITPMQAAYVSIHWGSFMLANKHLLIDNPYNEDYQRSTGLTAFKQTLEVLMHPDCVIPNDYFIQYRVNASLSREIVKHQTRLDKAATKANAELSPA